MTVGSLKSEIEILKERNSELIDLRRSMKNQMKLEKEEFGFLCDHDILYDTVSMRKEWKHKILKEISRLDREINNIHSKSNKLKQKLINNI